MSSLERRPTPEHTLEIFADPARVKDVIKGILHTIFFHRIFTGVRPISRDVLGVTLPASDDVDLETMIDDRATQLLRHLDSTPSSASAGTGNGNGNGGRGQLAVLFFEKKRKKASGYNFFGKAAADEDLCWEQWLLDVTLARPRTEVDAEKVKNAMEKSLQKAAMKIVAIVGANQDIIPPITSMDQGASGNPFPYEIVVNPKQQGHSQVDRHHVVVAPVEQPSWRAIRLPPKCLGDSSLSFEPHLCGHHTTLMIDTHECSQYEVENDPDADERFCDGAGNVNGRQQKWNRRQEEACFLVRKEG
ncbi:hypothetical protein FH972_023499 [Carpinus fangiana]|uniref:Autophagy-related protein 101 n=1 Tax=Carpinus fangiana TaxID=176857 RepID=A0A5N6KVR1_9ROSI|nr:hypothetical protein FH972_023499 [Carpinus fangiana]